MLRKLICALFDHVVEFRYESDTTCEKEAYCSRCGTKLETHFTKHELLNSAWVYLSPHNCRQVNSCIRCHQGFSRVKHTPNGDCVCTRCGKAAHSWIWEICDVCHGERGVETLGGYGNNPKVGWQDCPTCSGHGGWAVCTVCGEKSLIAYDDVNLEAEPV